MRYLALRVYLTLLLVGLASVANGSGDYYVHGSFPSTGSALSSAAMRAELDAISTGFAKLPPLSGNNGQAVVVNSAGTALVLTTGSLALGGNFTTSGAYATTLTMTAATALTLPTTGTLSTLAGSETLTNKVLTSPTIQGTVSAGSGLTMPAFAAGGTISGATGITSVGTIATGVWNGTAVGATYGGTGLDSHLSSGIPSLNSGTWSVNNVLTANQLLYGAASNAVTSSSNLTYDGTSFKVGTAGPHAIGGASSAAVNLLITGTGASATNPDAVGITGSVSANSISTTSAAILHLSGNTITTAAASFTMPDAAGVLLAPPTLSIGLGSTITNASTVKITGAPTGATNNYALWVAAGASLFGGATTFSSDVALSTMTAGSVVFVANTNGALGQDNSHLYWDNNNKRLAIGGTSPSVALEVSGQAASEAYIKLKAAATTLDAAFWSSDGTHDVYSGLMAASGATVGDWVVYNNGVRLGVSPSGSFYVKAAGPHAIGGASSAAVNLLITGTGASATNPDAVGITGSVSANSISTTSAAILHLSGNTITTAAASFTMPDAAGVLLAPPTLSIGLGSTITNASTVKITGAPTGATNNYALWVASGVVRVGSNGNLANATNALHFGSSSASESNNPYIVDFNDSGGRSLGYWASSTSASHVWYTGAVSTERLRINSSGVIAIGSPGSTTGAGAGDIIQVHAAAVRFVNNAGTNTVIALSENSSDQLLLGSSQHIVPTGTADTVALLAATQTLTNKTLSSPTLSGTVAGTPTWASAQTLPGLTLSSTPLAVGSGGLGISTTPTNGQIPIGNGTDYTAATLTAGNGTTIANASGSVTLNALCTYAVRGNTSANNATTPTTKFDLVANVVVLRDASNTCIVRHNPGTITNDTGLAGSAANGRDQLAAFTASSWVHFYWIWNGSTLATLSSATAPPTGPTLPSGYTHWAYAGAVFFNGSSQLLSMHAKGSALYYDARQNALNAGTAGTWASISLSSLVPPNAETVFLIGNIVTTSGSNQSSESEIQIGSISGNVQAVAAASAGADGAGTGSTGTGESWGAVPNLSQTIYYQIVNIRNAVGQTASVWVTGYQVPNGGE